MELIILIDLRTAYEKGYDGHVLWPLFSMQAKYVVQYERNVLNLIPIEDSYT